MRIAPFLVWFILLFALSNGRVLAQNDEYYIAPSKIDSIETKKRQWNYVFSNNFVIGHGAASMFYNKLAASNQLAIYYEGTVTSSMYGSVALSLAYKQAQWGIILGYEKQFFVEQNAHLVIRQSPHVYQRSFVFNYYEWPNTLFLFSTFIEYDFEYSKDIAISPSIDFGSFLYINSSPFDPLVDKSINKYFRDKILLGGSLRVKYKINYSTKVYLQIRQQNFFFDASSYFDQIDKETFSMVYQLNYYGVGVEILF